MKKRVKDMILDNLEHAEVFREAGVTCEQVWVQDTPQGDFAVVRFETRDPAKAFRPIATSKEPWAEKIRPFLKKTNGAKVSQPVPLNEMVCDWRANKKTHQSQFSPQSAGPTPRREGGKRTFKRTLPEEEKMNLKSLLNLTVCGLLVPALLLPAPRRLSDSKTEQKNVEINRMFIEEVVNKGNLSAIDKYLVENFIEHEEFPGLKSGREGVREFFAMFRKAFPDLHFTIEFIFAKDDKVVSYITINGTQKGEFMGMPPTGKKIDIRGIDIVRFENGMAVEHWGLSDSMAMMQQLGMLGDAAEKQ